MTKLTYVVRQGTVELSAEDLHEINTASKIEVQGYRNFVLANATSGAGGLTQAGGGTLTLTGNNTYTGNTRVSAGTSAITGSLQSGDSTSLYVDGSSPAAATLSLSGASSSLSTTGYAYVGYSGTGTVPDGVMHRKAEAIASQPLLRASFCLPLWLLLTNFQ